MGDDDNYEPSPWDWVREQVAEYEESGGARANTLRDTGLPIIIMTTVGHKSGRVRKVPLMRVEHQGGTQSSPRWGARRTTRPGSTTSSPIRMRRFRTDPSPSPRSCGSCRARSATSGGSEQSPLIRPTPTTKRRPTARSRCSLPVRSAEHRWATFATIWAPKLHKGLMISAIDP